MAHHIMQLLGQLVRQENERSMRENLERTLMMKNLTELNLQRQQQLLYQAQQQQHQQQQHQQHA
ncbi:GH21550 [Drosophila grimshawi]|uniref:GH21550 n=1 Tax=Drosophila grimshawi TaxID=7222 RepID=B4J4F3_DROGR|nr:GH21550 [Drosophila grimshawi]